MFVVCVCFNAVFVCLFWHALVFAVSFFCFVFVVVVLLGGIV